MQVAKKNGKIEFLRFIFCIIIIFFHINKYYFNNNFCFNDYFSLSLHGCMGVEFFFLVTGFLFSSSCYKKRNSKPKAIGKETVQYMFHKLSSILPYHLMSFLVTFIVIVIVRNFGFWDIVKRFVDALPNLFLIQWTGISHSDVLGLEWYISVMLLSLFILYPICRKYYDVFTRILAPLTGVFIIGYLCAKYGCLSNTGVWDGLVAKTQLRGLAEICLGAFIFEVSRFISNHHYSNVQRIGLTALEFISYVSAILYMFSTLDEKYEAYALYALAIGICLSFSNVTYGGEMFQNKFIMFLGKMSLPMYLSQNAIRGLVMNYGSELRIRYQILLIIVGTFLMAFLMYTIVKLVQNRRTKTPDSQA